MGFKYITTEEAVRRIREQLARGAVFEALPDEANILKYLKHAELISDIFTIPTDEVDPSESCRYPPSIYTDGLFLWSLDICYYIEKYHVPVPQEFETRMRTFAWTPPLISEARWNSIIRFRYGPRAKLDFPDAGFDDPQDDESGPESREKL